MLRKPGYRAFKNMQSMPKIVKKFRYGLELSIGNSNKSEKSALLYIHRNLHSQNCKPIDCELILVHPPLSIYFSMVSMCIM